MRVAVLCNYPFPEGLAATTRIRTYLKGLVEYGVSVDVFVYNPGTEYSSEKLYSNDGVTAEGIPYHYPGGRMYSKHQLVRVIGNLFVNKLKAICYIYKRTKLERIDALLIADDSLPLLYLAVPFCRLVGIKPVFVTDEFPIPIRVYLKGKISYVKRLTYDIILSLTGSAIFMTEQLSQYYNANGKRRSYILPTITDTSRFGDSIEETNGRKYLCYMGNLELSKDDVINIIKAFSSIAARFADIDLYLYGDPSCQDHERIVNEIDEQKLSERVFLKGKIGSKEVPGVLKNAHVLVSAQPNSKRAQGGFPTKLGEYLATGKPILLTDVGEISSYVKNRVHVYMVPPEDTIAYAQELAYILDHYSEACAVGRKGREYVCQHHDYKVVSLGLLKFLKEITDSE